MKHLLALTLAGGLMSIGASFGAQAAPGGQLAVADGANSQLVKVHGFHRSCRWGPGRGWWHRHAGPDGRPIGCVRRYYRSPGVTIELGSRDRDRRYYRHRDRY